MQAGGETATQLLHRLTSYEPGREWTVPADDPRVLRDLRVNELARLPWFFKRYPQRLPRIALRRELPATAAPAIAVLAGTARVAPVALDLPQLSRLLYLSAGVVRTMERPYGIHPFRAAGSAGGRFPLEVYIAVPDGVPLPPGVHWYDPLEHALVRVGPAPRGSALRWSSPVCRGVPAGVTANAAGGMCTGMPARCWANCWRWPAPLAWLPPCIRVSRRGGGRADWGGPGSRGTRRVSLVTAAQRAGEGCRLGLPWDQGAPADVPSPPRRRWKPS